MLRLALFSSFINAAQSLVASPAIQASSNVAANAQSAVESNLASISAANAAATAAFKRSYQPQPPKFMETFLRHMPKPNVVVCGCGKCGTSSMYDYIYNKSFGKAWPYGGSQPYIHSVTSDRWNSTWRLVHEAPEQGDVMNEAFTFAIIRDPQERLVSAWKSKLACGDNFHTDIATREWMTKELLKLSGSKAESFPKCLQLDQFLKTLEKVHQRHDAWQLDRHFLPQHLGCFYRFPPEEWSAVVTIEDPKALSSLSKQFGGNEDVPPVDHVSTAKVQVSAESATMLQRITYLEYKVFGEYLRRPSYVKGGVWV